MFKDSTLYTNCKHKTWGFYGHSDMCVSSTHSQQIEVTLPSHAGSHLASRCPCHAVYCCALHGFLEACLMNPKCTAEGLPSVHR